MSECISCGRSLAVCEWCGVTDLITVDGQTYPVISEPSWGGGHYHQPCRDIEQAVLKGGR